jgi:uncharacterized membrane protein YfcA
MRKIIALVFVVVGVIGSLYGIYIHFTRDDAYLPLGVILILFSLIIFSIGGWTLREIKNESSGDVGN